MRKKILLTLLGILIGLPILGRDFTYTYEGQTITYTVLDEDAKTCETKAGFGYVYMNEITSVQDAGNIVKGDLILPSVAMDGDIPYTLKRLGNFGFITSITTETGNSELTSVVIPETVEELGEGVFYGCTALQSVTGLKGLTNIGLGVFQNCSSLTIINLPESLTGIGDYAFNNCRSLTDINFSEGLTSIGDYAFWGCRSLTTLKFSDGLTTIGNNTFEDCSSLVGVCLPDGVTTIGDNAFTYCQRLILVIPPSVIEMGNIENVFKIIYPEHLEQKWRKVILSYPYTDTFFKYQFLNDGSLVSDDGKILLGVPNVKGEYSIPSGCQKVQSSAFDGCSDITTLTIPSSVNFIEADAFRWNSFDWEGNIVRNELKFERVNFEDWGEWYANVKLENIYSNPYRNSEAYAGGVRITTPELKEGMTEIPDYVNAGLSYENEVMLPSSLKRIGAYAFYENKKLYAVYMPDGLEEIGENAFYGCSLLENPEFPQSLKKIEHGAFANCTSLTEIFLPEGISSLGEVIKAPENASYNPYDVVYGVFEKCSNLEKISLAVDVDYLSYRILAECGKLNKVFLPTALKNIGDYAFYYAFSLDEISLPSTLESIGESAFAGKRGYNNNSTRGLLSKLILSDNVKFIGKNAFQAQSIEYLTLGKGLETISEGAFDYNKLKVINFSEGLTTIEENAFSYNNQYIENGSIGAVILPNSVTTISRNAFYYSDICELVIPEKVVELPAGSCGSPSVLTIGSGVKGIEFGAFGFDHLRTIRLKTIMPPSLEEAFSITHDQNDALTLIVNKGRKKYYDVDAFWKQIDRIVEDGATEVVIYMTGEYPLAEEIRTTTGIMPSCVTKMKVVGPLTANDLNIIGENMVSLTSLDLSEAENVTSIPNRLFENSLLAEIVFPANLESIGSKSFYNCRLLQLKGLPNTVKAISAEAFANCPEVKISQLPEALESIGERAFQGCGMTQLEAAENLSSINTGAFQSCTLLETVDLSASKLTQITESVFSGCTALDNIILPETVTSIGRQAFSGTAIRDIAFASGVSSFEYGAFSNCRRLVAANLPETVTEVPSNMFANCPRLITLSMPAATTSIGENLVYGDKKLANISCAANDAPSAEKGAFDEVRVRYISLVVPATSYRPYLNANQWGKFESIQNRIQVKQNKGVKVSVMLDKEYQDMLREDALEEAAELAAVEKAEESGDINMKMLATARMTRGVKARAATPRYFAALFDGAQIQTGNDGGGARIFLNPEEGTEITSILYKGEEMIDKLEGNSLLLPQGSQGTLDIRTNYVEPVPVESVTLSETELTLTEGDTKQLTVTISPENADDKSVKWESSNPEVATVNEEGLVEAISEGTAVITVTTLDGSDLTAKCEITVEKPVVLVESIELSETSVVLVEKDTVQLAVTITPEEATDKSVLWESSNPEVATVSEDGLIEAVAEGTCTITVTTLDGSDLSASCEVIVDKESGILKVAVDGIAVRVEGATIYVAGVEAGKAVSLYSLAGVHCATVVSDGSEIRFEAAPAQFYIVRAGKASIKVRL